MSGRSWEHPDTLNQWNDPRFCWFCLYEQFLFEDGLVQPRVISWTLSLLPPWEINLCKSAEIALLVSVAQSKGGATQKQPGKGFGSQEHPWSQGERDVTQALNTRTHGSWTLKLTKKKCLCWIQSYSTGSWGRLKLHLGLINTRVSSAYGAKRKQWACSEQGRLFALLYFSYSLVEKLRNEWMTRTVWETPHL